MSSDCHIRAQRFDINKKWLLLPQKRNFSKTFCPVLLNVEKLIISKPQGYASTPVCTVCPHPCHVPVPSLFEDSSLKIDLHNVLKVVPADSGGSLEGWAGKGR